MYLLHKSINNNLRVGILLSFLVCIFVTLHDGYPVPVAFLEILAIASFSIYASPIVLGQVLLIAAIFSKQPLYKNILSQLSIIAFTICWVAMAVDIHQWGLKVTYISSIPFAFCIIFYMYKLLAPQGQ